MGGAPFFCMHYKLLMHVQKIIINLLSSKNELATVLSCNVSPFFRYIITFVVFRQGSRYYLQRFQQCSRTKHFFKINISAEIAIFPEPQNITSGSNGFFVCGGTGKSLTWFINDTALDQSLASALDVVHYESADIEQCSINSTISILGGLSSNNTMVHCIVTAGGLETEVSERVALMVQGE